MGFWSKFGKIVGGIGSAVAAPFTAGTSLSWLPAAIAGGSAATELIGAKKASSAANSAAQLQQQSALQSNELLDQAANEAKFAQEPYLQIGRQATTQLADYMDPNSEYSRGFQGKLDLPEFSYKEFQAPNPQDVLNDPAIQFQIEQGNKALERSAAARGRLLSGETAKKISEYTQGVASQGYKDVYGRALTDYTTNRDLAQQEYESKYAKQLSEFGAARDTFNQTRDARTAALNTGLGLGQTAAGRISDIDLTTAGQKGANLQGGANALAAGKIAGANAWSGALSNIGQNVMDLYSLAKLRRTPTESFSV